MSTRADDTLTPAFRAEQAAWQAQFDQQADADIEQMRELAKWAAAHPNARAWGDVLAAWVRRNAWGILTCTIAALLTVWAMWLWARGPVG